MLHVNSFASTEYAVQLQKERRGYCLTTQTAVMHKAETMCAQCTTASSSRSLLLLLLYVCPAAAPSNVILLPVMLHPQEPHTICCPDPLAVDDSM
jgi:hypothetical protein